MKSVDAIREALGVRLLGRLATPPSRLRKHNELVMMADPTGREAEQFRSLRWSLDLANAEHEARAIMITSAVDGEGKSTTIANLAVALTRAGRRVVLIDADIAKPQLHRLFGLEQQPGLTDVELGDTWLTDALQQISVIEESSDVDDAGRRMERTGSLEVLPAGSRIEDPDELGFDRAMGRIIQRVRGRADIVLVDASPLLRSNAIALSAHVDAIIAVVRLKGLRAPALDEMGWMLEAAPAPTLGFVVTGAEKSAGPGYGYGYGKQPQVVTSGPRTGPTTPAAGTDPSLADGEAVSRPPSRSTSRPFGGLSPREAALRSAESRRAKSAQRAESRRAHGARRRAGRAPGRTREAARERARERTREPLGARPRRASRVRDELLRGPDDLFGERQARRGRRRWGIPQVQDSVGTVEPEVVDEPPVVRERLGADTRVRSGQVLDAHRRARGAAEPGRTCAFERSPRTSPSPVRQ